MCFPTSALSSGVLCPPGRSHAERGSRVRVPVCSGSVALRARRGEGAPSVFEGDTVVTSLIPALTPSDEKTKRFPVVFCNVIAVTSPEHGTTGPKYLGRGSHRFHWHFCA